MADRAPVVVIGAGAAGLMAALFAAREGADVVVIEGTKAGGKKIIISGGGRCNVLPSEVDPKRFVTASSPNVLRRLLLSWPLDEQIRFFEDDLGIKLTREHETGKLFPASNRASDVRDGLVNGCRRAGVQFRFNTLVTRLAPAPAGWTLSLGTDETMDASAVIIATGGLSVPNTGSDGFGLRTADALGHQMKPTYAALTPLTADPAPHAALSGISLSVALRPAHSKTDASPAGFLFTHRGYSGPAVLDVSHLATLSREAGEHRDLLVQWTGLGVSDWNQRLTAPGAGLVMSALRGELPERLAEALMSAADVPLTRTRAELRRDERSRLIRVLTEYPLPWTGDEGYKKAEVTGGGVALGEVDPKTLESRRAPALYFCGEVLDAFGPIGGYNFMWAWSTGRAAGAAAAARRAQGANLSEIASVE